MMKHFLKREFGEISNSCYINDFLKRIKIQVFRLWIICAADAGAAQVS